MALTLTLSGNSSILTTEYFPPIDLQGGYVCGLVDFQTYNSIPNVDEKNNLFHIGKHIIEIPIGSYEIDDIANYLYKELAKINDKIILLIQANNNTLKSEIKSNAPIYFNEERSIGQLLGFAKRELKINEKHTSDLPVSISKVNVIRIECNIVGNSYINNIPSHTIHEFSPEVGPGYKIVEVPSNVIYLPVSLKRISTLTLKLIDQNGDIINFKGETITIRLHLKPQDAAI